jgi:hypothetical protein
LESLAFNKYIIVQIHRPLARPSDNVSRRGTIDPCFLLIPNFPHMNFPSVRSRKAYSTKGVLLSVAGLVIVAVGAWVALRPGPASEPVPTPPQRRSVAVTPISPTVSSAARAGESAAKHPLAAHIQFDQQHRTVVPNVIGEYPRLMVPASALTESEVPFAEANPGDLIVVQAEDGGELVGAAASGAVSLDEKRVVKVPFRVSAYDGMHRVSLRYGALTRTLEFWVGPEQPVLARN